MNSFFKAFVLSFVGLAAGTITAAENVRVQQSAWVEFPLQLESPHPYVVNVPFGVPVKIEGAKRLRLVFSRIEVENNYDYLVIKDGTGRIVNRLTGTGGTPAVPFVSGVIEGDSAVVEITQDSSGVKWGFQVSQVQAQFE